MADWREKLRPVGATGTPPPMLRYGAPNTVRLAVETARPRDKLDTLKQYYPDAEPTPDGNFIYTDETGQPTLFNQRGLDVGDVAGLARPAAEILGAAGGGALATPSGPGGMLAAGTLGGMAGGQATDVIRKLFGLPQTTGLAPQGEDLVTDAITNTTGEMGGMALQAGLPRLGRALAAPEAQAIGQAATRLGITPTAGMVSAGPIGSVENTIARVLPGSRAMREQVRVFNEVANEARTAVPGVPGSVSLEDAGAALKTGSQRAYDRFRTVRQRLDDQVYNLMPRDTPVPTTELRRVRDELAAEIARAPGSLAPELGPVLEGLDNTLADASQYGGNLPAEIQRRVRRVRREQLDLEATAQLTPGSQRWLRDADRAMRADLRTAARNQSPQALRALDRHDRLVVAFRGETLGRESIGDSLDKMIKTNSDEDAYKALMSSTGGANRMQQVLQRLSDPERRVVARAAWDNMLTTPSGNFNLNRLRGQWEKAGRASSTARQELFGRVANMGEIEDLMTVIGGMRDADLSRNFSNTAYTMMQASIGEKMMGEMAAKIAGVSGGASALGSGLIPIESLTYLVAPYLMSEVIHSPGMARAMVNAASGRPVQMTETIRRGIGRAVGRAMGDELGELTRDKDQDLPAQPVPTLPTAGDWRSQLRPVQ